MPLSHTGLDLFITFKLRISLNSRIVYHNEALRTIVTNRTSRIKEGLKTIVGAQYSS